MAAGDAFRLAKVVGAFAILASGVSQEYGVGINFVMTNSLGSYPKVTYLVPLAMLVAGIMLLPKMGLYARFSQVMPRAGSTYVWMTRSVNQPVGFVVAFMWFVGVVGAMGFIAFSFAIFLAGFLKQVGVPNAWATTQAGHVLLGGLLILLIFLLHYSGVGNYGRFVTLIFILVLVAAATVIVYGFVTSQPQFMVHASKLLGGAPRPPADQTPSLGSFISVVTLFMFAYAGITAATSLGGEARDATKSMPRGLFGAWFIALILYTLVALAVFHAVPWWT
ncbi:MAG: APC family permease, partial [Chloroflexota bacterium]